MSDTFFGYQLELGEGDEHGPIEDETIDLRNDETFGDAQEDFDWDEVARGSEGKTGCNDVGSTELVSNLSQLVVDDEPDDPAIITLHSKRIPDRKPADNLDELFGPKSPPAYLHTLDGLTDPKHDIWGSPVNGTGFPISGPPVQQSPRSQEMLKAFNSLSAATALDDPSIVVAGSAEPRKVLKPLPALIPVSSGTSIPATAITVEELERQLTGESSTPATARNVMPPRTERFPAPNMSPFASGATPPPGMSRVTPPGMSRISSGTPPGIPLLPPGMQAYRGPRPLSILQRPPMQGERPVFMRMGHPLPPQGIHPSQQCLRMSYRQPMPIMRPVMGEQFRGSPPPGLRVPPPRMPGWQAVTMQPMPMARPAFVREFPPGYDEYAGLMTQYDKDWILNIQLKQLHTDDPFVDDYYYTMLQLEKEVKRSGQASEIVLPAMGKLEERHYTPAQFEGSLGRLTTSSVHKPRQVLDIGGKDEQKSHNSDTRKYRQTLLILEQCYSQLLQIDEYTKKIPSVPQDQREQLITSRQHLLSELYKSVDEHYTALLGVRKGRCLVLRLLLLLNKDESHAYLRQFLLSLQLIIKKEITDPMHTKYFGAVQLVLSKCDMSAIVEFCSLVEPHLKLLFRTQFGCSLCCSLILQAENIHAAFVDLSTSEKEQWSNFLNKMSTAILAENKLAELCKVSKAVYDHLQNSEALTKNKDELLDKIVHWFTG